MMKKYKRWQRKDKALQKRLSRICNEIDSMLRKDFPFESFNDEYKRNIYEKRFRDLFNQTGYPWDKEPLILVEIGHICCSSCIVITFYIKGKNGQIIEC